MDCLFCKIIRREIPAVFVYEDEHLFAFNDIHPQAPTHILVVPKKHIATIDEATPTDEILLGKIILSAQQIARNAGLADNGYRLVYNVNTGGGQMIYHIHLHILGGRQMTWPPG